MENEEQQVEQPDFSELIKAIEAEDARQAEQDEYWSKNNSGGAPPTKGLEMPKLNPDGSLASLGGDASEKSEDVKKSFRPNPNAIDRNNDGILYKGTPWEMPARSPQKDQAKAVDGFVKSRAEQVKTDAGQKELVREMYEGLLEHHGLADVKEERLEFFDRLALRTKPSPTSYLDMIDEARDSLLEYGVTLEQTGVLDLLDNAITDAAASDTDEGHSDTDRDTEPVSRARKMVELDTKQLAEVDADLQSSIAALEHWKSKEYKDNTRSIDVTDETGEAVGQQTIASVNDRRKRQTIATIQRRVDDLQKLKGTLESRIKVNSGIVNPHQVSYEVPSEESMRAADDDFLSQF